MGNDLATREGALAAIEIAKREALDEFNATGRVRPRAVIFIAKDPAGVVVRDPRTGEPTYTIAFAFAETISCRQHAAGFGGFLRDYVERSEACGVIGIFEMWLAEGEDRSKFPKDFGDGFEGRKEGIMVSIEHVAFDKPLVYWSPITRDHKGKGTAAPFVDGRANMHGGNLMHLLRRSAS